MSVSSTGYNPSGCRSRQNRQDNRHYKCAYIFIHHFEPRLMPVFYLFTKLESINPIAISQEIFRCGVEGNSFDDLLCGPLCRWMGGHVEMDDASAIMGERDKDEQNLEPDS